MFCSPGCRASDWHARLGSVAGAMGGRAGRSLTGPKPKTLKVLRSCAPQQRRLVEEEVEGRAGRSRVPRASAVQRANRLCREQSRTVSTKGDWMPKIHGRARLSQGRNRMLALWLGGAGPRTFRWGARGTSSSGAHNGFHQRPQGFKQESLESALSLEPKWLEPHSFFMPARSWSQVGLTTGSSAEGFGAPAAEHVLMQGRRLAGSWTVWRASANTSARGGFVPLRSSAIWWRFQARPCQGPLRGHRQHARPTVAGFLPRCRPEAGRICAPLTQPC